MLREMWSLRRVGVFVLVTVTTLATFFSLKAIPSTSQPDRLESTVTASTLFQGMSTLASESKPAAVEGTTLRDGAAAEVNIIVATDTMTVAESMSIESSVSVSYLGKASVSAKAGFFKSLQLNSFSTTILVTARTTNYTESAQTYTLKDGVSPVTSAREAEAFFGMYGDSFVDSVTVGAEYYAALVIQSSSVEEQKNVTAELKAKGIFKGVSAESQTQTAIQNFRKQSSHRMTFTQKTFGWTGELPDQDKFIMWAKQFPGMKFDNPTITSFTTRRYYQNVKGVGEEFAPINKNIDAFLGKARDTSVVYAAMDMMDQIRLAIDIKNTFAFFHSNFVDPTLNAVQAGAQAGLQAIKSAVNDFLDDPIAPVRIDTLNTSIVEHGLPNLQWKNTDSDLAGKLDGGIQFRDPPITVAVRDRIRISKIELSAGQRVDWLRTTYTSDSGASQIFTNGKSGGAERSPLNIAAGDFVSHIYARTGSTLDNITIWTKNGDHIAGGGQGGANYHTLPSQDVIDDPNKFITGFFGRAGNNVDAIGVVTAQFLNCRWTRISRPPAELRL